MFSDKWEGRKSLFSEMYIAGFLSSQGKTLVCFTPGEISAALLELYAFAKCELFWFSVNCTLIPNGRSHFLQWALAQSTLYYSTAIHATTNCNKNPLRQHATVLQAIAATSHIIKCQHCGKY